MKKKQLSCLFAILTVLLTSETSLASYNGIWRSPLWRNDGARPDAQGDCIGDNGGTVPSKCIWHEMHHDYTEGAASVVSNTHYNCNSNVGNSFSATWTYEASASVTTKIATKTKFELKRKFKEAVNQALGISDKTTSKTGYTSGKTASIAQAYTLNIPAHQKAYLTFIPKYRRSLGWLEVHYGRRMYGHYYWYYNHQGSSDIAVNTPLYQVGSGRALGVIKPIYIKCRK